MTVRIAFGSVEIGFLLGWTGLGVEVEVVGAEVDVVGSEVWMVPDERRASSVI